jgi:hypothetical protein
VCHVLVEFSQLIRDECIFSTSVPGHVPVMVIRSGHQTYHYHGGNTMNTESHYEEGYNRVVCAASRRMTARTDGAYPNSFGPGSRDGVRRNDKCNFWLVSGHGFQPCRKLSAGIYGIAKAMP